MELIQWHKESTQQSHQKAQINTIPEIGSQIGHLKVKFVQMFIHKRHQGLKQKKKLNKKCIQSTRTMNNIYLFDNGELIRCMIKQRIEGIPFASHANIIVLIRNLFFEFTKNGKRN
jgi:hypothetical protein